MADEKVLFELRHAPRIHGRFLRMGTELHFPTRVRVIVNVFPWEALALAVLVGPILFWWLGPDLGTALSVSFLLLTATLQLFAERDIVTSTRLVSRRGLFGRRRREMRLQDIEGVEVGYFGLMRDEGIGNITVRSGREAITVWAVENAGATADRIQALVRKP
jgi:hypothetical protein